MNEILVYNELDNLTTAHAYLYEEAATGMWAAYGYSAYKVRTVADERGIETLAGFSRELSMPVVLLNAAALKALSACCPCTPHATAGMCLSVHPAVPPHPEGYRIWTSRLREWN